MIDPIALTTAVQPILTMGPSKTQQARVSQAHYAALSMSLPATCPRPAWLPVDAQRLLTYIRHPLPPIQAGSQCLAQKGIARRRCTKRRGTAHHRSLHHRSLRLRNCCWTSRMSFLFHSPVHDPVPVTHTRPDPGFCAGSRGTVVTE